MDIENRFKRSLVSAPARAPLGTWLMAAAPATAEALGYVGFDFLVVDMEHVPIDFSGLADILRAVGCTPAQAVVRLPWNDQVTIKRALDAGAQTIMLPFVQTVEEARAAVSFAHYPPRGVRGVAAVHRGSCYGRATDYFKRIDDEIAVIVQLETPDAIARLPEIAAVEGVDAVFVGPGDLAAAMGHMGDISHTAPQRLIADAARVARRLRKPIGIVGPNPQMVARFLDYGYDYAAIASDIALMTGRAADWLGELKALPARATPDAAY